MTIDDLHLLSHSRHTTLVVSLLSLHPGDKLGVEGAGGEGGENVDRVTELVTQAS